MAGEAQSCETLSLQENMDLKIDGIKTKSHLPQKKGIYQIHSRSTVVAHVRQIPWRGAADRE